MITVNAPDGSTVTFPNGTSEGTINQVMMERFAPEAENSLGGSLKQFGVGLGRGAIGLAGLPADAVDLASRGYDALTGSNTQESVAPIAKKLGSENIQKTVEGYTGEFRKPQTMLEHGLDTIGSFAPAALVGPGGLARRVATQVVVPGVASEAAGQLTEGTAAEPYARIAGALAGGVVGSRLGAGASAKNVAPAAPTWKEVGDAARQGYQSPVVQQLEIATPSVARLAADIRGDLVNRNFRDFRAPQTFRSIEELAAPAGPTAKVADIDGVRQMLGQIAVDRLEKGTERAAARHAIARIDNYLANVPAADIIAGDADTASKILKAAQANYAATKRGETVSKVIARADLNAASAGSGANIDNATRQAIKSILTNEKRRAGFSPEEIAQMEKIVRGTPAGNTSRLISKLSMYHPLTGWGPAILGGLSGNPALGVLSLGIGNVAHKAAEASTKQQVQQLDEMLRRRSELYKRTNDAAMINDTLHQADGGGILGLPPMPPLLLQAWLSARAQPVNQLGYQPG